MLTGELMLPNCSQYYFQNHTFFPTMHHGRWRAVSLNILAFLFVLYAKYKYKEYD